MAAELTRRRFSGDEYHRLAEAGVLSEDDRVELIDGEIVCMSPVGSLHAGTVNRLNHLLSRALGDTAIVAVQNPVRLADDTEPEPDIAVLRSRGDFYTSSLPTPAEVLCVVEVADTSLLDDRRVKLPRYAQAGVGEVWLIDLDARRIERHTNPERGRYQQVVSIGPGQQLASTAVPALSFAADQILGLA